MKVPLLDLRAQQEPLREDINRAIARILDATQFILGAEVAELEKEIAAYSNCEFGIGCASGTDALLLALMTLDVGAGDEIITTPYSFFATVSSITRLGATPVFVDIDPNTYNLNVSQIEAKITPRTKAIMPVHLYGQCAEMDELIKISEKYDIALIEDAAQAIGAEDAGRRAGAMSAIGCFSFYPSKNLGAAGDAGMLTTNNPMLAHKLAVLRVHGSEVKYYHKFIGLNSRLDGLQAAILRVKLPHLDSWSRARQKNAETYKKLFVDAGLSEQIDLPAERPNVRHIYNQFTIRIFGEKRDALKSYLAENEIGTDIYYPVPLHLQECFAYLGYKAGDLPESERAAHETLALPIYPELTGEQQEYVVEKIAKFLA
jgi:dTDP-4-amino-4,6-dideoxygalactose transaminase